MRTNLILLFLLYSLNLFASNYNKQEILTPQDNDIIYGHIDAPVTIIEYSSLTCPYCAQFHKKVFPELKKEFIDTHKVKYVIRELAFDKQSYEGIILINCAATDKRSKFIDILFDQQLNWAFKRNFREILYNIGSLGGVSKVQFEQCLANENLKREILNVRKEASLGLGIDRTPVFYINNEPYKGLYNFESFSKHIKELL